MHDDELWQVFSGNGTPVVGCGATRQQFKDDPSLIMGNAHVWMWRRVAGVTSILLQKRSLTKADRPGWYHASAAGHINVGENPVETALRESREELGLRLQETRLYYIFSMRTLDKDPRDIVHVYLYQLSGDEVFEYKDGEVESCKWYDLETFKDITSNAREHRLVPQGVFYFNTVLDALKLQ
jgi:8-oxo-dGTP pyrophosphatase MutT (NUDIX family)